MASGATEGEVEELSGRAQGYPRDLLRRFAETSCDDGPKKEVPRGGSEEIELSLGLSLNGCFGVEPKAKRLGLVRSSSIASLSMFEHDFMEVAPLTRTCSLPTETEEELRKRKELQSLKRLEAKRKRSEKRNSKSGPRDSVDESLGEEVDERRRLPGLGRTKSGKLEVELNGLLGVPSGNQLGRPVNGAIRSGLPGWAATGGGRAGGQNTSQVSIGPQGSGGSSGASDMEHQPMQEDRSPPVIQSLADHTNQKGSPAPLPPMLGKPKAGVEELSKKTVGRANGLKEIERNVMEEMPCVSTKGDGPNGRRIEGFLYRYRKGEEVRIVCVCHGSFLTPAEFVRHAGGGDVDHPLRHIVVYPTPSAFL